MIYFIGAGPGAADLITVKGKELLEKADLIIYAGSLVNPELLNYAKPECIIMDSAKMTLEEVIAAMVPAAQAGKLVVRLHTGDPSVYGAHREQIDLLRSYNLDFEIVPGVSSFCAAAACLDAEYTLPNVSQSVIITRMEGRTPVPNKQKIADYAAHKATMVIFLSSGMLEKLQKELIAGGYTADTPAAIVYKASCPHCVHNWLFMNYLYSDGKKCNSHLCSHALTVFWSRISYNLFVISNISFFISCSDLI